MSQVPLATKPLLRKPNMFGHVMIVFRSVEAKQYALKKPIGKNKGLLLPRSMIKQSVHDCKVSSKCLTLFANP